MTPVSGCKVAWLQDVAENSDRRRTGTIAMLSTESNCRLLSTSHVASLPTVRCRLLQGSTRDLSAEGFGLDSRLFQMDAAQETKKASKFRIILLLHLVVPTFSMLSSSGSSSGPATARSAASSATSLPAAVVPYRSPGHL